MSSPKFQGSRQKDQKVIPHQSPSQTLTAKPFHFEIIWRYFKLILFFWSIFIFAEVFPGPGRYMDHQSNDNIKDHQDIVNNKIRRLHRITVVIQYHHPLFILPLVDTNRYNSNSLFHRHTENQLANDHLQDVSGFVFHFCIRLQIAMSTRVPQELCWKTQLCDCLCFVLVVLWQVS